MHISSPANLQHVDQILAANDRLADPRGLVRGGGQGAGGRPHPGLLPRGGHALDRGRPGAGDPGHRPPARDRAVARDQQDPQRDADRAACRRPTRTARTSSRTTSTRPRARASRARIRTSTTTTPATTTTATGCSSPSRSPSCGSASSASTSRSSSTSCTRRARATRACGCRRTTTASAPRVTRCNAVDQRARHGRRPRPVRRGQEGRLLRRRVRDLGHGRHPELRDVRGLGAAAVRGRVAARPRVSVHELQRPTARQPGAQSMRNLLPYDKADVDARADGRLPRDRHVPGARRRGQGAGALVAGQPLPRAAQRDALDRRAVGVRDPGRAAGHVRASTTCSRCSSSRGSRSTARPAEFSAGRQDLPGRLVRDQHAPAAGQVGRADHGQPALPGRRELLDAARC